MLSMTNHRLWIGPFSIAIIKEIQQNNYQKWNEIEWNSLNEKDFFQPVVASSDYYRIIKFVNKFSR